MSNDHELDSLYELVGQDAQAWLEQAKKLKLSADVIRAELSEVLRLSPHVDIVRIKQLGYIESFMMLTGLAFENLIKGIDIAQNPTRVTNRKLDTRGWSRGGHALSDYAQKAKLPPEQVDLLRRLEEYVVWVGRYAIPLNADAYINSTKPVNLKTLRWTDFDTIDTLFDHLSAVLMAEWIKRQ